MVIDITPAITTTVHFIMFMQTFGYLFDLNVLYHRKVRKYKSLNLTHKDKLSDIPCFFMA